MRILFGREFSALYATHAYYINHHELPCLEMEMED